MFQLDPSECPCLRRLDVRPIAQQGRQYIYLRDPLQLSDAQLLLPQPIGSALAFCDGTHTPEEICALFKQRSGYPLELSQLNRMLSQLDDAYMLDNARYRSMLGETERLFRSAPNRQPALAGRAYPANPAALADMLDGYLADVVQTRSDNVGDKASLAGPGRGLLSPHIDYARGGPVYAQVWKAAHKAAKDADLVLMFGTDHNGSDRFTLTKQSYATPFGVLPTDEEIVGTLASVIGEKNAFAGELRHRGEHSLELVTVWLHHMRQGKSCHLVPILVGGLHDHIRNGSQPAEDATINAVLETLEQHCRNRKVLVVASGDLAHVGPAFGGAPLNQQSSKTLREDDDRLINQMESGDPNGFFEEIRRVRDGNNVCGVTPIYLTMRLLEMLRGSVQGYATGYDTCPADEVKSSVVTVGGVLFQ